MKPPRVDEHNSDSLGAYERIRMASRDCYVGLKMFGAASLQGIWRMLCVVRQLSLPIAAITLATVAFCLRVAQTILQARSSPSA